MHWGNPEALWALAGLPFLAAAGWWSQWRRRRVHRRLGDAALIGQLYDPSVSIWRARRLGASFAIYALLAVAGARPQYGRVEQTITRAGVDVIVAIDTSPSMLATDVAPTRLEKAKEALRRLVLRLKGNRVGIVAFAGDAFLLCPLTHDYSLASLVLQAVGQDSVNVAGTDLGRAIEIARAAVEHGGAGSPVLVLLTDGEDNEGKGLEAARRAAKDGMKIYGIGIGTERGAPVPDAKLGFKEESGSKVVSRLDMKALAAIAEATGGAAYAAGENPYPAIGAIVDKIDRLEKGDQESRKFVIHQDRYMWFAAPAAALLAWLLLSRPRKSKERAAALAAPEKAHA